MMEHPVRKLIEAALQSEPSSRQRRLQKLRVELDDRRMQNHRYYQLYRDNLIAWIAYIEQMSDDDFEADLQLWMAGKAMPSGIHLAGREHHPDDVHAGIHDTKQELKAQMKRHCAKHKP